MVALGWMMAVASAGDVWMTVQATSADGSLRLQVPASCVGSEPTTLRLVNGQSIDVQAVLREVQAAKVGTIRKFDVPGDNPGQVAQITVTHEAPTAGAGATALLMAVKGPKGGGLSATIPLDKDGFGQVMAVADLGKVDGLSLKVDERDAFDVVRRYAPRTLIEVTGKDGGTITVTSQ